MTERAEIAMVFEQGGDHTRARASLTLGGATFTGNGRARRNPEDTELSEVGAELAAARALSDLAHRLVEAAAGLLSR
ncbi:MAG TPA: dsRBD fold-containing protein [Acidimicrobiales bacterium]|nr:dsRBD fold-containing protein [Acidimicrobiales bacterium]